MKTTKILVQKSETGISEDNKAKLKSLEIYCKISDNVSTCFTFMFPFFQTSFKSVKL